MFERREYSPWMAYGQFEDASILFAWRSTKGQGGWSACVFFASGHDHHTSIEAYLPPLEPEARNCWDYPHGDGRGLHDPQHRNQEPG